MGILKGGESYAVPGDPEQLLLWTGKAGAIRITVGGKPVAPLGQPVQTVRDISLAPGSLLARKLCPRLGISEEETETVAWLVLPHLAMRNTAFKRDQIGRAHV